jgi:hypothetical protein
VDYYVQRTCNHKEPKQLVIWDISLDTIENVLGKINKEKYIEYLLNRILEQREYKQELVCLPYLI